eukprot:m.153135 g.153135  ORF g.153135 m.153135 type:complete len:358 (-) comp30832_c0_seq1:187-1260(-)
MRETSQLKCSELDSAMDPDAHHYNRGTAEPSSQTDLSNQPQSKNASHLDGLTFGRGTQQPLPFAASDNTTVRPNKQRSKRFAPISKFPSRSPTPDAGVQMLAVASTEHGGEMHPHPVKSTHQTREEKTRHRRLSSPLPSGHLFKVLVVGNASVGKTSIIKRYAHDIFSEQYMSTIGVDFALKILHMGDEVVKLQLWDIAGQEQFGSMTRVYYKGAVGAFIVINVAEKEGLSSVKGWKDDIDTKICLPNGDPIPVVLLANKCDLEWAWRSEELDKICESEGIRCWFDVSAKEDVNVHNANNYLVRQMMRKINLHGEAMSLHTVGESLHKSSKIPGGVRLDSIDDEPGRDKGFDDSCCA